MFNPRRITTPINLLHREEAVIIGTLPPGTIGFDCNTPVTPSIAEKFLAHGAKYVIRYVRRSTRHTYDLTVQELVGLLQAGMGVGVVQHVAAEGWTPTANLGASYGAIAAEESRVIGIPPEVTVWCDLEGVHDQVPRQQVIDYCNAWYSKVKEAGYQPGIYVGYGAGLSGVDLYYKLRFQRYWSAYNLNKDQFPVRRGVQMEQLAYPPSVANPLAVQKYMARYHISEEVATALNTRVAGVPFQYDAGIITGDKFGDTPTFILPGN